MTVKKFTYANMQRLTSNIKGDMSQHSSSYSCTFEEVYENLGDLDTRLESVETTIGGLPYDPQTETVTIVSPTGTYNSDTETITFVTA